MLNVIHICFSSNRYVNHYNAVTGIQKLPYRTIGMKNNQLSDWKLLPLYEDNQNTLKEISTFIIEDEENLPIDSIESLNHDLKFLSWSNDKMIDSFLNERFLKQGFHIVRRSSKADTNIRFICSSGEIQSSRKGKETCLQRNKQTNKTNCPFVLTILLNNGVCQANKYNREHNHPLQLTRY